MTSKHSLAGIGVGQTWQTLGGSRALGTQYQNATGRPIMVCVSCSRPNTSSRATLQVSADAVTWVTADYFGSNMNSTGATDYATGNAIVPANWYYKCTVDGGQGLNHWSELR